MQNWAEICGDYLKWGGGLIRDALVGSNGKLNTSLAWFARLPQSPGRPLTVWPVATWDIYTIITIVGFNINIRANGIQWDNSPKWRELNLIDWEHITEWTVIRFGRCETDSNMISAASHNFRLIKKTKLSCALACGVDLSMNTKLFYWLTGIKYTLLWREH